MADKRNKHARRSAKPLADGTADATASVVGTFFRVIGTILLILLVTGLLFMCIFAYYVKNCLSTELDVELEDFTLSLSSSILYQAADGNWQKLVTLSGTENRIWVDYEDIQAQRLRRLHHHAAAHQEPHEAGRYHRPAQAAGDLPGARIRKVV